MNSSPTGEPVFDDPLAEIAGRLPEVAAVTGTPCYVYSLATLRDRVQAVMAAVSRRDPRALVCYAVKANGNPALLRQLGAWGLGADVTSGGELFLAGHAGIPPERTIFSGVGKTDEELAAALARDILSLHVESETEFARIARLAEARRKVVAVGVRLNPDVVAGAHPAISTGGAGHKFGVPAPVAMRLLREATIHPWLRPVGLAAHIGSQIQDLAPFREAAAKLVALADELAAGGVRLAYLDAGGGLGIGEGAPNPAAWVETVAGPIVRAGYGLVLEPGRSIVGPAGILLTRVLALKEVGGRRFAIVDAGMSDLIRPTLYGAVHPIRLLGRPPEGKQEPVDIVGPICETGDFLARDTLLPPLRVGDLLAVEQAGAYGYAMSSNYNGRLRPAELLIDGEAVSIIRPRQQLEDLL
jgi:diaminopimelate decarboxylase